MGSQSHIEIEMIFNQKIHVLKGQHNLAQGNALGLNAGEKIVRAITLIKEILLFRTSVRTLCFSKIFSCNSVRMKLYALFIEFSRTVFVVSLYPGRCPGQNYIGLSGR